MKILRSARASYFAAFLLGGLLALLLARPARAASGPLAVAPATSAAPLPSR